MSIALGVGLIFYEDRQGIARTLESISSHVDRIFCIDGVYRDYPAFTADGLSHDGSREVVKQYSDSNAILFDMPFVTEVEKRSRYLDLCKEYDCNFLLIIDTDEYVGKESDWSLLYRELEQIAELYEQNKDNGVVCNISDIQIFDCAPKEDGRQQWHRRPRIWYRPWEMEYYKGHSSFQRRASSVQEDMQAVLSSLFWFVCSDSIPTLEGIKLYHDTSLRTEKHQARRDIYKRWRWNGGEERQWCSEYQRLGEAHKCTYECRINAKLGELIRGDNVA